MARLQGGIELKKRASCYDKLSKLLMLIFENEAFPPFQSN